MTETKVSTARARMTSTPPEDEAVEAAIERLTALDNAWDLSGVYKDTEAGQMDLLCAGLAVLLASRAALLADNARLREAVLRLLDVLADTPPGPQGVTDAEIDAVKFARAALSPPSSGE